MNRKTEKNRQDDDNNVTNTQESESGGIDEPMSDDLTSKNTVVEDHQPHYLIQYANKIADEHDADVVMLNGTIGRLNAQRLIHIGKNKNRRENVLFVLVTLGGDPDAAYIIARHLQSQYQKFSLFVPELCKSAGTLIALGANELIISDYGELGPLDVQLSKKDELGEMQSGWVGVDALAQLQSRAFDTFEEFFLNIKIRSRLTTKTCARIASDLTTGLYKPVYAQIDPMHLGVVNRAMSIAWDYGQRLVSKGSNIEDSKIDNTLNTLIRGYSSHRFVIDRDEAKSLFRNVREPSVSEQEFTDSLGNTYIFRSKFTLSQVKVYTV